MVAPEALLWAASSEDIHLTDGQRTTINQLLRQMNSNAPTDLFHRHRRAIAAAIRAGNVDAATFRMPLEFENYLREQRSRMARALATLHETLTKEQRALLVDAVALGLRPAAYPAPPPADRFPFAFLLGNLELTGDQEVTLAAQLAQFKRAVPSEAQLDSIAKDLEAKVNWFKTDAFDPERALALPTIDTKSAEERRAEMARALVVILSVLAAHQRETLAAQFEERPLPPPSPPSSSAAEGRSP
jgi:Spy/CpxP family protein refolding chaperone